jgi:cyclopropane fatty-acyl-phospholipid synthase-like methyltransferase
VTATAAPHSARAVVAALRDGVPASPELVNSYYGLCIPFYREFLGDHWHTGFYDSDGAIGPRDQLRMEALVAHSAGVDGDSRVLDVGCGVGGPACHVARSTGARVHGLTPNQAQLEIARAGAAHRGLADRVRFDLGEACHLPYPGGSFDVVLFFESACHFPDRARFFREAWRVLKPGGRLAGEDWVQGEQAPQPLRSEWAARIASGWAIPALGSIAEYAAQMTEAGFRVELARDMREEMALLRGFVTQPADREAIGAEMRATPDPIRQLVMEGVVELGEAAALGAFTIGRFLATKPREA